MTRPINYMVKIRITGLPDEMDSFLKKFRERFLVTSESKPYKNSSSKFVRKYMDVEDDGNKQEKDLDA